MRQENDNSYIIVTPKIIKTERVDFNEITVKAASVYDIGLEYRVWIPSAETDTFFDFGLIDRKWVGRLGLRLSGIW